MNDEVKDLHDEIKRLRDTIYENELSRRKEEALSQLNNPSKPAPFPFTRTPDYKADTSYVTLRKQRIDAHIKSIASSIEGLKLGISQKELKIAWIDKILKTRTEQKKLLIRSKLKFQDSIVEYENQIRIKQNERDSL